LEDPGIDGKIILRWIFRKWEGWEAWTGLIWFRTGTGGNDPSGVVYVLLGISPASDCVLAPVGETR
jgi:hypothetical protein